MPLTISPPASPLVISISVDGTPFQLSSSVKSWDIILEVSLSLHDDSTLKMYLGWSTFACFPHGLCAPWATSHLPGQLLQPLDWSLACRFSPFQPTIHRVAVMILLVNQIMFFNWPKPSHWGARSQANPLHFPVFSSSFWPVPTQGLPPPPRSLPDSLTKIVPPPVPRLLFFSPVLLIYTYRQPRLLLFKRSKLF